MKNTLKIFIAVVAVTLLLANCKKEDISVCASCTELNTQTKAADYCGPKVSVDKYVETLKTTGAQAGQNWSCTVQ
jgi:hypothetical protein